MPLILCPDCNKQVSDSAKMCLNCGRPIAHSPVVPKKTRVVEIQVAKKGTGELELDYPNKKLVNKDGWDASAKRRELERKQELTDNIKLALLGILVLVVVVIVKRQF